MLIQKYFLFLHSCLSLTPRPSCLGVQFGIPLLPTSLEFWASPSENDYFHLPPTLRKFSGTSRWQATAGDLHAGETVLRSKGEVFSEVAESYWKYIHKHILPGASESVSANPTDRHQRASADWFLWIEIAYGRPLTALLWGYVFLKLVNWRLPYIREKLQPIPTSLCSSAKLFRLLCAHWVVVQGLKIPRSSLESWSFNQISVLMCWPYLMYWELLSTATSRDFEKHLWHFVTVSPHSTLLLLFAPLLVQMKSTHYTVSRMKKEYHPTDAQLLRQGLVQR